MRTTTTTTTVTVTVPNPALLAAESLLTAVRELRKAGGAYYLRRLVSDEDETPHELTCEALAGLLCEMLLEGGDPANSDLTYERARQVVADAIDSGKSIAQQLVLGMGWTVIPTYEEFGGNPVVEPVPGACTDSVCSVLHADPRNPIHPPVLCPTHNVSDCSPAFNGCPGARARATEPVARYRESSWVINGGAADYGS